MINDAGRPAALVLRVWGRVVMSVSAPPWSRRCAVVLLVLVGFFRKPLFEQTRPTWGGAASYQLLGDFYAPVLAPGGSGGAPTNANGSRVGLLIAAEQGPHWASSRSV